METDGGWGAATPQATATKLAQRGVTGHLAD
uniref:Uncharacterized protein n=1 Tax=Plectus sambesii TaxID=2011161 RepID=A0A914WUL3_9BILA